MNYYPRDGKIPEVGKKIRVHHPHLEDGAVGTVAGIKWTEKNRFKILLEGSSIPSADSLGCSWEEVEE